MAGLPWFELDVDMPDDPKCVSLGDRLRNPLAFGYVVRLYAYCYRHATDRFEAHAAASTIEGAAGWKGKRGALLDALVAEHFVDSDGSMMVVHGVANRLEPHIAKQARDRERMRERRANVARTSPRHPSDVQRDKDKDKDIDKKQLPSDAHGAPGEGAPRRRKRPDDTDPRLQALRAVWEEEYQAVYGKPPERGASENAGYHRVIGTPPEEFRERARRGLVATGFLRCGTAAKLTSAEVWAQLAAPVAPNGATVMPIRRELK